MKKYLLLLMCISSLAFSQVSRNENIFFASVYSKEIALYKAKEFLYKNIIGKSDNVTKFEITPLAAATSGEVTSLLYQCEEKNKEGLLLGFFGEYWNENGVHYQGYAFKNLPKDEATEFLNKINDAIENYSSYIKSSSDNNNILLSYKDIDIIVYNSSSLGINIRLFWNNFDSEWNKSAFERSKKRFEKKTK